MPLSEAEAKRSYPDQSLRVAAQGILEKPDGDHRIIHDGTLGVQLNTQILIEDRLENPRPREMACIMETSMSSSERCIFSLNADIAKAHSWVEVRVGLVFFSCIAGRARDIVGQQRDENENEIKIP